MRKSEARMRRPWDCQGATTPSFPGPKDHAGKNYLRVVNRFVPCSATTTANKTRHHLAGLSVSHTSRAPVLLAKHSIRLLHFLFICVGGWVRAYTDTPYNIRIHLSN
jgi:hypothetical protein